MKSTAGVAETAKAVQNGEISARAVVIAALARIEINNNRINAFTEMTGVRAVARADSVDLAVATGKKLPLADTT